MYGYTKTSCVMNNSGSETCWNLTRPALKQLLWIIFSVPKVFIDQDWIIAVIITACSCNTWAKTVMNVNNIHNLVHGSRIPTIECLGTDAFTCLADPICVLHSMFPSHKLSFSVSTSQSVCLVFKFYIVTHSYVLTCTDLYIGTKFYRMGFPKYLHRAKLSFSLHLPIKIHFTIIFFVLLSYGFASDMVFYG